MWGMLRLCTVSSMDQRDIAKSNWSCLVIISVLWTRCHGIMPAQVHHPIESCISQWGCLLQSTEMHTLWSGRRHTHASAQETLTRNTEYREWGQSVRNIEERALWQWRLINNLKLMSLLQTFVSELLDMCGRCGMRPPDPRNLPQIAFHDGRRDFPGETMKKAAQLGQDHFGAKPNIIFVLLPDTGSLLSTAYISYFFPIILIFLCLFYIFLRSC